MSGGPKIIDLGCSSIELQTWEPDDANNVKLPMVLELGWEGEDGSALFYFTVATPEALKRSEPIAPGFPFLSYRSLIVMSSFSFGALQTAVENIVNRAPRTDIDKCFRYLTRYFTWEHEYVVDRE